MKRAGDTWYFAYGSNLHVDQKELRTGTIRRAEPARLPGYRLAFNKRGSGGRCLANICPDPEREVWGVAYLCSAAALREMDRFEGVAAGHYARSSVRVVVRSGELLDALTYVAGSKHLCAEGLPAADYLHRISPALVIMACPTNIFGRSRRRPPRRARSNNAMQRTGA